MFHRRPVALSQLPGNTSLNLARMSAIEGFSRSILVSILPLVALEALGSKENVAIAYLIGGLLTLSITLNIGTIERYLQRRWVVTLGGGFLVLAALLLYSRSTIFLPLGIGLRSAAASVYTVCLSLYIMDYIGKKDLTLNESRRMQYTGLAWLAGPALGSWLVAKGYVDIPFLLSAIAAFIMLAYFWRLRLGDNKVLRKAQSQASNPWQAIKRYSGQKRLRIAYSITVSRSCYWVSLYVYGPIYVVEAGLPVWSAGVLLSGVSTMLFLSPVIRRISDRFGTRQVIYTGLTITGLSLLALGFVGSPKPLGVVFWVSGAVGGVLLDVLGNIPFMRSVKSHERVAMTSVFSTWREASELLTPLLVSAVLVFFPFQAYFFILALMHFMSAVSTSFLPKRL
ncbi:MFS transporter [Granulosicoccus antarcticus]|uniref:Multidrug resistance protein MdtG n=1 Tax=Granulosicoccus antarcticus IMCC3135 TaxID=1192854 RepID=A0A2Z2NJG3_9GAMM|nr:MFS transporter [Granulosicoccus antarcticus]ASJ71532.1 Multidrug resistance protein MdtG [Granulosicoccus antarcticus IMCC3135]